MEKQTLILYPFKILPHFFYHFHHKLYIWKILIFTLFVGAGGGSAEVYVLYNVLNVDNYGWY